MTKIIPNPNKAKYEEATAAVQRNGGYCPCALFKTKQTKCVCWDFLSNNEKECHCGRYVRTED